jgi:hypothetical protein
LKDASKGLWRKEGSKEKIMHRQTRVGRREAKASKEGKRHDMEGLVDTKKKSQETT